jgi:myosin heavy subunit
MSESYFDLIEMTLLSSRMSDYPSITQGKTRIPGINDGEEFELTDVSQ